MDPLQVQRAWPREVGENLDKYELGIAAQKIYDFIWDSFCDWYIELTQGRASTGEDETARVQAQKVLLYVLTETLKLLHPFMPFITEEIYQALPHEGDALMVAAATPFIARSWLSRRRARALKRSWRPSAPSAAAAAR